MKLRNIIIVLLFTSELITCTENSNKKISTSTENIYFNITNVLEDQQRKLITLQPKVHKTITMDDTIIQVTPKVTDWKSELILFEELDISKVIFRDGYTVTKIGDTTIYMAQKKKYVTRKMKVVKYGEKSFSFEALYFQKKGFYSQHRKMYLNISDSLLTSYKIIGFQHLTFNDTLNYKIEVSIKY